MYQSRDFEKLMKTITKKKRLQEDQKILDEMLVELKKKHEDHKKQQIDDLTMQLKKAKG